MTENPDVLKVAVCEAMIAINADGLIDTKRLWLSPLPIIPPTAIDWIGDRIVAAILAAEDYPSVTTDD